MGDFKLVWGQGSADLSIAGDDLGSDEGLRTAVLISLFTDRRAEEGDSLPGSSDRRGHWADAFLDDENDRVGSRLWLLERSKISEDLRGRVELYVAEALEWMVSDGVVEEVKVETEISGERLYYLITLNRPDGESVGYRFEHAWSGEEASNVPDEPDAVPAGPASVGGLVGHWDAARGVSGSSPVTLWADQSGEENHWIEDTATGGTGPTLSLAVLNGLPALTFDGENLMSQLNMLSGEGEMVMVLRRTRTDNQSGPVCFGTGGIAYFCSSDKVYTNFASNTSRDVVHAGTCDDDEWVVLCASKAAGYANQITYTNNVARNTELTNGGTPTSVYLGSGRTSGLHATALDFEGQVAEFAVWNSVLAAEDRTAMFDYLNAKYALGL